MGRLEELDRISRERALTRTERYELERAIARAHGRRAGWGLIKALARRGIKRDRKVAGAKVPA